MSLAKYSDAELLQELLRRAEYRVGSSDQPGFVPFPQPLRQELSFPADLITKSFGIEGRS